MSRHYTVSVYNKKTTNFSGNVVISEKFNIVLNQLTRNLCDKSALNEPDKKRQKIMFSLNKNNIEDVF